MWHHVDPWLVSLGQVVAWRNPKEGCEYIKCNEEENAQQHVEIKSLRTRGGNIFSAARRGTEKPP
jgi:hypothetical protein